MLDDFLLQHIRRRQVVEVVQAVVLEPEDVQAGLVARHQVGMAEVPEALAFLALVAVGRAVAVYEVAQVVRPQRPRLEREVPVGAQVVNPDPFGMHLAVGRFLSKNSTLAFTPCA